jgi:hypothetical protein
MHFVFRHASLEPYIISPMKCKTLEYDQLAAYDKQLTHDMVSG